MTSVQEAFDIYQVSHYDEENYKLPAKGLVQAKDINGNGRLYGEIAYYRSWLEKNEMPSIDVKTNTESFNEEYDGELMYIPRGVEDLYYLDNQKLGLDNNKVYMIDISNGIIYAVKGYTLDGVDVHSLPMYKAVSGDNSIPNFSGGEVLGIGDNIVYAGEDYYKDREGNYVDENGNKVEEPVENPYGFRMIASGNNLFKLYNNGELWGKGVKGIQLNTSKEEMEKINSYVWKEWKVPEKVKDYKKIILGSGNIFFIDKNDDLWVYGNNSVENKLGLTQDQQIEYTGREVVKIELDGKKVSRVFSGPFSTFLITTDNCVLVAGRNTNYELGLGHNRTTTKFEKLDIDRVEHIEKIYCCEANDSKANIIKYDDSTFYLAGFDNFNVISHKTYQKFTQIFDGIEGLDIDQDIKDFSWTCQCILLKNDGSLWLAGHTGYMGGGLLSDSEGNFKKYNIEAIDSIYASNFMNMLLVAKSGNCYSLGTGLGNGKNNSSKSPKIIESLKAIDIKEVYGGGGEYFIITETGDLYGSGYKSGLGINESASEATDDYVKLNIDKVDSFYNEEILKSFQVCGGSLPILIKAGKYYMTGGSNFMFGNDILQKSWNLVAENVKFFNGKGNCYVDKDGYLWVAGDSRYYGLGEKSQNYEVIENYIKCTDENISGNVEKCYSVGSVTYVLLKNKELWGTGLYNNSSDLKCEYPGWTEKENKTKFVKILENIEFFDAYGPGDGVQRIAIASSGDIYVWGVNYNGAMGMTTRPIEEPTLISLPSGISSVKDILSILCFGGLRTCILSNNGLFFTGTHESCWDGGHTSTTTFSQYTHNLNGAKITQMVSAGLQTVLFLTQDKKVLGYGPANMLGRGITTTELIETSEISELNNKDIVQLVGGNGYYIAIASDGSVWGTGSNLYGVLGRWAGSDRNLVNSRYRTAFEWVECPELEI